MRKRLLPVWGITLLFVMILYGGASAAPPMLQVDGLPVYGMLGTIKKSPQPQFDDFFMTHDGQVYGIVGVNAQIEREINRFANLTPVQVKLWGTLYDGVHDVGNRQIVVSELLVVDGKSNQGGISPQVVVSAPVLNVRSGPSTAHPTIGQVMEGDAYSIVGKSTGRRPWYLICCNSGFQEGWVSGELVKTVGNTDDVPVVLVAPPPGPRPDPNPPEPPLYFGWKTTYFDNPDLVPPAVAFADIAQVDFSWGAGSPQTGVPPDDFSVRFEKEIDFAENLYRLNAQADDGIRVWLDGLLVIDEWHGATGRTFSTMRRLSGKHSIKIEYFEAIGDANVRFWYEIAEVPPGAWSVAMYDNVYLSGDMVYVGIDYPGTWKIDHNWGTGSPVPGLVPVNNWSGRWRRQWFFDGGDVLFTVRSDDGSRVWLDGHLVINAWRDGRQTAENTFRHIGIGTHTVTVEYYDRSGLANLEVEWYGIGHGGLQP